MNDLLAGYEDQFKIKNVIDFDNAKGATIAAEVNMLKQASEQQMDLAMRKEQSLTHGESIDNYMDMDQCERAEKKIDR